MGDEVTEVRWRWFTHLQRRDGGYIRIKDVGNGKGPEKSYGRSKTYWGDGWFNIRGGSGYTVRWRQKVEVATDTHTHTYPISHSTDYLTVPPWCLNSCRLCFRFTVSTFSPEKIKYTQYSQEYQLSLRSRSPLFQRRYLFTHLNCSVFIQ